MPGCLLPICAAICAAVIGCICPNCPTTGTGPICIGIICLPACICADGNCPGCICAGCICPGCIWPGCICPGCICAGCICAAGCATMPPLVTATGAQPGCKGVWLHCANWAMPAAGICTGMDDCRARLALWGCSFDDVVTGVPSLAGGMHCLPATIIAATSGPVDGWHPLTAPRPATATCGKPAGGACDRTGRMAAEEEAGLAAGRLFAPLWLRTIAARCRASATAICDAHNIGEHRRT